MVLILPAGSRRLRLLRRPLLRTTDRAKAERSRFTYRPEGDGYVLSLLGVLNGITGFAVWAE